MQPDTPCHRARPASWETMRKKKRKEKGKRLQKKKATDEHMFRGLFLFSGKAVLPAEVKKVQHKKRKTDQGQISEPIGSLEV